MHEIDCAVPVQAELSLPLQSQGFCVSRILNTDVRGKRRYSVFIVVTF